jgi:hypothetical protein
VVVASSIVTVTVGVRVVVVRGGLVVVVFGGRVVVVFGGRVVGGSVVVGSAVGGLNEGDV